MQCPECGGSHIRKGRTKVSKITFVWCGRQFIDQYAPPQGYSDQVKRECLKMYVNGNQRFKARTD